MRAIIILNKKKSFFFIILNMRVGWGASKKHRPMRMKRYDYQSSLLLIGSFGSGSVGQIWRKVMDGIVVGDGDDERIGSRIRVRKVVVMTQYIRANVLLESNVTGLLNNTYGLSENARSIIGWFNLKDLNPNATYARFAAEIDDNYAAEFEVLSDSYYHYPPQVVCAESNVVFVPPQVYQSVYALGSRSAPLELLDWEGDRIVNYSGSDSVDGMYWTCGTDAGHADCYAHTLVTIWYEDL
jgi:hypothetical protein